jgi:hypothetical protein
MRNLLRTLMFAAMLLAAGSAFAQIAIGIRIGPPPPPPMVRVLPPRPGPEFLWVGGYWYPVGMHYKWHAGYWTHPPYPGAYWVVPRHDGARYFAGYWGHWDRDRNRDFRQ